MTQHIFNVDTSSDRRAMRKWMKQRHKQVKSNPFFAVAQTYLSVTETVNDCSNSYLEKERTLVLCLWVGCPEPVRQAVGRSRGHVVSQSQRLLLQLFWSIPGHQTLTLALQTHQKQTVFFTQACQQHDVQEQSKSSDPPACAGSVIQSPGRTAIPVTGQGRCWAMCAAFLSAASCHHDRCHSPAHQGRANRTYHLQYGQKDSLQIQEIYWTPQSLHSGLFIIMCSHLC